MEPEMTILTDRPLKFRLAIAAFIDERRQAKLKGEEDKGEAGAKYEYEIWLADAARRVSQIQAVTHVLKATHPDARGSNLHLIPNELPQHDLVGSHLLGDEFAEDIVGNAAALDVFKFLKVEVEGKRLLEWMRAGDPDLQEALSEDPDKAKTWIEAFSSLVRHEQKPVSHTSAKQLYWLAGEEPIEDDQYHLLQPLFSSALAHAVHSELQDALFGEENKNAKEARRRNSSCDDAYREYRDLAIRKLGGTKPQNISQLNSERGGVNYLLSSLPPRWNSNNHIKLLRVDSVLTSFQWFDEVPELLRLLIDMLLANPNAVKQTRDKRRALEQALGQQLSLFGDYIRFSQEPGWTYNSKCCLPLCEKLWLDPDRAQMPARETHVQEDVEFNNALHWGDWPEQVAHRFANWLNEKLHKAGVKAVGDVEYKHWARQVRLEIDSSSSVPSLTIPRSSV